MSVSPLLGQGLDVMWAALWKWKEDVFQILQLVVPLQLARWMKRNKRSLEREPSPCCSSRGSTFSSLHPYWAAHDCLCPQIRRIGHLVLASSSTRHEHGTQTCVQAKHPHTLKSIFKKGAVGTKSVTMSFASNLAYTCGKACDPPPTKLHV